MLVSFVAWTSASTRTAFELFGNFITFSHTYILCHPSRVHAGSRNLHFLHCGLYRLLYMDREVGRSIGPDFGSGLHLYPMYGVFLSYTSRIRRSLQDVKVPFPHCRP